MPRREFIARRLPWCGLVLVSDIARSTTTVAGEFWRNWGKPADEKSAGFLFMKIIFKSHAQDPRSEKKSTSEARRQRKSAPRFRARLFRPVNAGGHIAGATSLPALFRFHLR
jgi:hypothetical protein